MNKKIIRIAACLSAAILTVSASSVAYATEENTTAEETTVAVEETASAEVETEAAVSDEVIEKCADIDGDGKVDAKDAVKVLKYYAEYLVDDTLTLSDYYSAAGAVTTADSSYGDPNGDGRTDSKDAVIILKYYANKILAGSKAATPATEETVAETVEDTTVAELAD